MEKVWRSLTIPLDPGEFADFDTIRQAPGRDVFSWVRRGEGFLGFGRVAEYSCSGPERFLQAQNWWEQWVGRTERTFLGSQQQTATQRRQRQGAPADPVAGPIVLGSLTFSEHSSAPSRLYVPRILLQRRGAQTWLTWTVPADEDVCEERARAELRRLTDKISQTARLLEDPVIPQVQAGSLSEEEWMDAVASAIRDIRLGVVDKVVLARDLEIHTARPIDRWALLHTLYREYAECWTYGVGNFFGATPEMLVRVDGGKVWGRVLAGTVDRANAPDDAEYPRRMLLESPKQLQEHEIAVESFRQHIAQYVSTPQATGPFVLTLPNVWHLASDMRGQLRQGVEHANALKLAEILHPTAAVCGTPQEKAAEKILELEHLDRGPYAGPVGWMDALGNGEWGIGLRGAVLESSHLARLYAGCGIVEASHPREELVESESKFRPMLHAFGITGKRTD